MDPVSGVDDSVRSDPIQLLVYGKQHYAGQTIPLIINEDLCEPGEPQPCG